MEKKNAKPIVDPKAFASKVVASKVVDSVLDAVPGTDNATRRIGGCQWRADPARMGPL